MALFDEVFNKASIYDMLFFNIKAVLIHPTLDNLQKENPVMYERWKYLSKVKHNIVIRGYNYDEGGNPTEQEIMYEEKAIYYPEFTRIVAITYASLYAEKGQLKRFFKKIVNEDEFIVIDTFMDMLHQISSEGVKSTPSYFPMFCGHNIINYDIPLLIKRYVLHRDKFERNKELPVILKNCLNAKPWESGVVDTINAWRFNGNDYTPLMLIADYPEVSKKYWKMITDGGTAAAEEEALEYVSLQSATQTNLVIQLINELRQL
jgi:lipopolysaccharide biosynthesis glycosyltransferase